MSENKKTEPKHEPRPLMAAEGGFLDFSVDAVWATYEKCGQCARIARFYWREKYFCCRCWNYVECARYD